MVAQAAPGGRRCGRSCARRLERSRPRLVTVLGGAGVGKSRLVAEALELETDLSIAYGRCLSYGEGATYRPLAEVIRSIAGITDLTTPEQGASSARIACTRR